MLDAQSSMEQTWYNLKQQNTFVSGTYLGDNILSSLNAQDSNSQDYAPLAQSPCQRYLGYVHYKDGSYVTGLNSGSPLPADLTQVQGNGVLCIDVNGDDNPNQLGQDVFLGNFNPSGAFDGGATYPAGINRKNFLWNSVLYNANWSVVPPNTFPLAGSGYGNSALVSLGNLIVHDFGGSGPTTVITMSQLQSVFQNPTQYGLTSANKPQLLLLMENYTQISTLHDTPGQLDLNDIRAGNGQTFYY